MKHHTATIDHLAISPSANNSTRPRLLVVEDDAAMRELHALVLNLQGYQVETACDGAAGLERLAEEEFDLVITDRAMPNLDGVSMVLALRSAGSKYPDRHGLRFARGGTATATGGLRILCHAAEAGAHRRNSVGGSPRLAPHPAARKPPSALRPAPSTYPRIGNENECRRNRAPNYSHTMIYRLFLAAFVALSLQACSKMAALCRVSCPKVRPGENRAALPHLFPTGPTAARTYSES